jgi:hypothetical protein
MVTAIAMASMLNFLVGVDLGVSPAPTVDSAVLVLLLVAAAAASGAMMPDVRKVLEYACVGILIGFGFLIASLFTSTVQGIEEEFNPLILHLRLLVYYTYAAAAVSLCIAAGCIAGFGFIWGRNLQRKITRKGK